MSQYQRMVSYLYRYEDGVKKNNTGFARIELRGDICRVTVQLRDALTEQPEVAFFRQEPQGMQKIPVGHLSGSGNMFRCRIETSSNNVMSTGYLFSDMDGLIIYIRDSLYYATTWKEIRIHLGYEDQQEELQEVKQPESEEQPAQALSEENDQTEEAEDEQSDAFSSVQAADFQQSQEMSQPQKAEDQRSETSSSMQPEIHTEWEAQQPVQSGEEIFQQSAFRNHDQRGNIPWTTSRNASRRAGQRSGWQNRQDDFGQQEQKIEAENSVAACQWDACRQCPQQGRFGDFGRHILDMFPRMYPFEISRMNECVRLELKDIGCLPVPYWSLAGNPFLLHGYYCYRHILFTKLGEGEYCIGVPGIYNQENQKQADHCGFGKFKTLSDVPDRQGAFGYWLYPIRA